MPKLQLLSFINRINTSFKKNGGKYIINFLLWGAGIALCGQLIAQLFTVNQLNKVTGIIATKEAEITSYEAGRKRKPNYSLVVTLKDKQTYNIDFDTDRDWAIADQLRINENITLYNPSFIYNLLSLDCLDFGSRVSQVEANGKIIYSFKAHQSKAWFFIAYLITAILILVFIKSRLKN
ncbi:hypothetical protein G7092_22605 [Mucilaginibacter sp. HC2]|uniref:hypothetical protein n=1 Tax=Mucilaginibacter inviolabilis TaxID=2714892 RepID=UPI00140CC782|nr:hypothetical protein [Mucilaginibacter inviolabilis]NHA06617.1 hypothetical protein [Mucilaginibacter inviolabilis]